MVSTNSYNAKPVGVLGAGSFGAAVSNLIARNRHVMLFTRRQEIVDTIMKDRHIQGQKMNEKVMPTTDIRLLANSCDIIFPVVRSANFRQMMKDLAPFLRPDHIIIHGTKGFDVSLPEGKTLDDLAKLSRDQIKTMSEVIVEESVVKRVGCFSGPNLARELAEEQLAGTVIASRFEEVFTEGRKVMESSKFKVYESHNLTGVELTGALKNVMAIASGALSGLGYGENARAMLISRGLAEMVVVGKSLGGSPEAFLGLAGVGDLIATCSSPLSRNYSVGFRIAKGESLREILGGMNDVVEGIDTVKIVNALVNYYGVRAPITQTLYKILFRGLAIEEGINYLMNFPLNKDVSFL